MPLKNLHGTYQEVVGGKKTKKPSEQGLSREQAQTSVDPKAYGAATTQWHEVQKALRVAQNEVDLLFDEGKALTFGAMKQELMSRKPEDYTNEGAGRMYAAAVDQFMSQLKAQMTPDGPSR